MILSDPVCPHSLSRWAGVSTERRQERKREHRVHQIHHDRWVNASGVGGYYKQAMLKGGRRMDEEDPIASMVEQHKKAWRCRRVQLDCCRSESPPTLTVADPFAFLFDSESSSRAEQN